MFVYGPTGVHARRGFFDASAGVATGAEEGMLHDANIRAKPCNFDPALGASLSNVKTRRARAADLAGRARWWEMRCRRAFASLPVWRARGGSAWWPGQAAVPLRGKKSVPARTRSARMASGAREADPRAPEVAMEVRRGADGRARRGLAGRPAAQTSGSMMKDMIRATSETTRAAATCSSNGIKASIAEQLAPGNCPPRRSRPRERRRNPRAEDQIPEDASPGEAPRGGSS